MYLQDWELPFQIETSPLKTLDWTFWFGAYWGVDAHWELFISQSWRWVDDGESPWKIEAYHIPMMVPWYRHSVAMTPVFCTMSIEFLEAWLMGAIFPAGFLMGLVYGSSVERRVPYLGVPELSTNNVHHPKTCPRLTLLLVPLCGASPSWWPSSSGGPVEPIGLWSSGTTGSAKLGWVENQKKDAMDGDVV